METAWKSDIGRVRRRNEDFLLADAAGGIFLLADGMGGHRGGDVASRLAVKAAHGRLAERAPATGAEGVPRLLAEALAAAHSAVARRGMEKPDLADMGTTLDIVYLRGLRAWICHVGDSRVYLFRRGELRQVTVDDNLASALARRGVPEEDIPSHARHILTQAVGVSDELVPELRLLELEEQDILLMCSDGLTGMVPDDAIAEILGLSKGELGAAATHLIDEANARGGHDNVSALLVSPGDTTHEQRPPLLLTG